MGTGGRSARGGPRPSDNPTYTARVTAMLQSLTLSLAFLTFTSSLAGAAPCMPVVLKPDETSTVLQGKTTGSDTDFTCFQLTTGIGRRLHLSLIRAAGPALAFNIGDVVDSRDDYSFVTGRDSYKIDVYGIFRVSPVQPFRISVTASSGANRSDLGDPAATVSTVFKLKLPLQPALANFRLQ